MKFAALEAGDASVIAALSERLAGEPFRIPSSDLAFNLERVSGRGDNYSIGVYDNQDRLRGYLLAWIQRSLLQERPGPVLLVEDSCFDPDYSIYLMRCLELVVAALERDGREDHPIETVVNPDGLELVAEHEAEFADLGYIPVASHQYEDPVLGCTMTWLRYLRDGRDSEAVSSDDSDDTAGSFDTYDPSR